MRLRILPVFLISLFVTGAASRGAEFFVVQADGLNGAYTSVNAAIAASVASSGGASGDTIEIRSNFAGTLQVFAQSIDLSTVNIASTDEADWLTIRVREGDSVRFRTSGTLLAATGNSSGWKLEGNSLGYESLQFGDRADFDHSGTNTYRTSYPHNRGADIAPTASNYAIRRAQFTGARSYAANVFDGTDYELDAVAAFDHGTNHYDINPKSGNAQDWGDLAVVRGNRVRALNLYGEHGGHNNWKFEAINAVVRDSEFTGYWGDISPSAGSRATLVESAGSRPAPHGPVLLEGVIVRDSGDSVDNSKQAAMKTEGNRIIIRDSFFFDTDSHLWHMNFANAKASNRSYFSGHAFYHNTSFISKGTWWNNFQGCNAASGDAQFENNLIANNLFQQVADNDKNSNPAQIVQYDTSGVSTNGFPNGFHGTIITGNIVGGPSPLKQVNLRTSAGNTTFAIDAPPISPVDLTNNVYDNVVTEVSFADVGSPRARTVSGFAVSDWGTGASAGDAPPLAVVTTSSSETTFAVANARPFYDGWGIRGEVGDYIYIGATAAAAESAGPVQIDSVDYDNQVVTLSETRVVTAGDGVWFGGNPINGAPGIRKDRGARIPDADNGNGGGNEGGNGGANGDGNGVRSGLYDANSLKVSATSAGDGTATVEDSGGLDGEFLEIESDAVGDFIVVALTVAVAQTYEVNIRVHQNPSRGTFQLAIDNGSGFVDLGPPQDLYAPAATFTDLSLGIVNLNPGRRLFRFTVIEKNADSAGYGLSLDAIKLTPTTGKPEVAVTGNGLTIVSGDDTPGTGDNTDFGSADIVMGTVLKDFNIQNVGDATLTLGSLSVGGDFGVYTAPPNSIAGGGSAGFTIAFIPTETGLRTTTASFSNSDADENPYTFVIAGTGTSGGPGVNLLANPGFETTTDWANFPTSSSQHDGSNAYAGTYRLKIRGSAFPEVWQQVAVTPGTPYEASVWNTNWSSGGTARGQMQLDWYQDGTPLGTPVTVTSPNQSPWMQLQSGSITAPGGATHLRMTLKRAASVGGNYYFDEAEIAEVSTVSGTRVVDEFSDADETPLALHAPDVDEVGTGWPVPESNAQIMGNALQLLGNDTAPIVIDAGVSNAVVTVDFTPVAGSRDGLVVRFIDRDNRLELNARHPNGDLRLLNISGGGLSTLDSTSFTWTPGTTYELKVVVDGSTVTGYVDGVELVSAQTSAHSQGTAYGLQRRNSQDDTRFDNFTVEAP